MLRSPLARYTRYTITDPGELRRQLAFIRRSGVAVARGTITPDELVVAAPVRDPSGRVAAAIWPLVRVAGARPRELARLLSATSRSLSQRLAGPARVMAESSGARPARRVTPAVCTSGR
ncbi:IclR family transcriptional regulator domain-containing protein [Amycolatopsis thermalba]|uniref:IclR family transcriptional regulator domain-containing protein n=1 Tax=Amycolatopsis thermalba TaxID=944492 RepID=UPI0030843C27